MEKHEATTDPMYSRAINHLGMGVSEVGCPVKVVSIGAPSLHAANSACFLLRSFDEVGQAYDCGRGGESPRGEQLEIRGKMLTQEAI